MPDEAVDGSDSSMDANRPTFANDYNHHNISSSEMTEDEQPSVINPDSRKSELVVTNTSKSEDFSIKGLSKMQR